MEHLGTGMIDGFICQSNTFLYGFEGNESRGGSENFSKHPALENLVPFQLFGPNDGPNF
jgi:hypothetical protein